MARNRYLNRIDILASLQDKFLFAFNYFFFIYYVILFIY